MSQIKNLDLSRRKNWHQVRFPPARRKDCCVATGDVWRMARRETPMDDFTGRLRKIEVEDIDPRLNCERHRRARDGSGIEFEGCVEYGRLRKFRLGPTQQASENQIASSMR